MTYLSERIAIQNDKIASVDESIQHTYEQVQKDILSERKTIFRVTDDLKDKIQATVAQGCDVIRFKEFTELRLDALSDSLQNQN